MEPVRTYFNAERQESLLFIAAGTIAIAFSVYFLFNQKEAFYKGMAVALTAIALIQVTVGCTVFVRSPKDIARVEQIVSSDRESIKTEEIPRMQTVMKNFVLYRYIEIALMAAGLVMMFAFRQNEFIKGLGIGLFIQSALMLSLDYFAEKRGAEYLSYLLRLT